MNFVAQSAATFKYRWLPRKRYPVFEHRVAEKWKIAIGGPSQQLAFLEQFYDLAQGEVPSSLYPDGESTFEGLQDQRVPEDHGDRLSDQDLILGAKAMIPSRYESDKESYRDAYNAIVEGQNAGTYCDRCDPGRLNHRTN